MHSQIHGTWFQGIPGIKIVPPSNPADAKGLLKSALRDDNPVILLEHKRLYSMKGPEPTEETVPHGKAAVAREGGDVTLVSALRGVRDALEAAEELAGAGVEAEVVDPRSLRPLDHEMVLKSVARTNRVVLVEEDPGSAAGRAISAASSRRGTARARRRLDRRHRRHAGSLQSHARGRVAA